MITCPLERQSDKVFPNLNALLRVLREGKLDYDSSIDSIYHDSDVCVEARGKQSR